MTPAASDVPDDATGYEAAALRAAELALGLARIDRFAAARPDGAPESVAGHTVALALLAPALAAALEPGLDPCLVTAYAVVRSAAEVLAGDTATATVLTGPQRAAKQQREQDALRQWQDEAGTRLPWLPAMIAAYWRQEDLESRWTWAVDKLAPMLVHRLRRSRDLREAGVSPAGFRAMTSRQRGALQARAGGFPALLALYDQVTAAVQQDLDALAAS